MSIVGSIEMMIGAAEDDLFSTAVWGRAKFFDMARLA